jgi:hypothetical protein
MQTGAQVASDAVQGILSRIDQLAAKLGTTAANLWQIYVGQAKIEGIRDTGIGVLILVLSAVAFILAKVFWNTATKKAESAYRYNSGDGFFTTSVMTMVVGGGLFAISLFWFYGAFGEFYNPQYWAFQHLTQDLKNLF